MPAHTEWERQRTMKKGQVGIKNKRKKKKVGRKNKRNNKKINKVGRKIRKWEEKIR